MKTARTLKHQGFLVARREATRPNQMGRFSATKMGVSLPRSSGSTVVRLMYLTHVEFRENSDLTVDVVIQS